MRSTISRRGSFVAAVIAHLSLASPGADAACATTVGNSCSAYIGQISDKCVTPGRTYVSSSGVWRDAARFRFDSEPPDALSFFHAVDSTTASSKFGVLFVGLERISDTQTNTGVALSQNEEFNFNETVGKTQYHNAVTFQSVPPSSMRTWATLPALTSALATLDTTLIRKFDFPQGVSADDRLLHARLYRFEAGSVSCIPFSTHIPQDVGRVLGTVVETTPAEGAMSSFRVDLP